MRPARDTLLDAWDLPRQLPDELAISIVARHFRHWGYMGASGIARALDLRYRLAGPYSAGPVALLARTSFPDRSHTYGVIRVLNGATLLPYRLAFVPKAVVRQMMRQAIARGTDPFDTWSANYEWHPRVLRFCPECFLEDRAAYGEAYWHRAHQLPAVVRCSLHGTYLLESIEPYGRRLWHHLRAPSLHNCRGATAAAAAAILPAPLVEASANASLKLLSLRRLGTSRPLHDDYRLALMRLGLSFGTLRVDKRLLDADIGSWMSSVGLAPGQLGHDTWWRRVYARSSIASTPLQHLVFRQYLEQRSRAGHWF